MVAVEVEPVGPTTPPPVAASSQSTPFPGVITPDAYTLITAASVTFPPLDTSLKAISYFLDSILLMSSSDHPPSSRRFLKVESSVLPPEDDRWVPPAPTEATSICLFFS